MPTEVRPTTTSTTSVKPIDDGHQQPHSSTSGRSAPDDRRSSTGSLASTTALFLWLAYLVIIVALPEADQR